MRGLTVKGNLEAKDLKSIYLKCHEIREKPRMHALWLVKEGMSAMKTASIIGVSERSVRRWVHRYNDGGIEAVKRKPGSGRRTKLNRKQIAQLEQWIGQPPLFASRWTLKLLCFKAKSAFGISYTVAGMWFLIRRRLFRLKVPRPYNPKADKTLQENFKKKHSN